MKLIFIHQNFPGQFLHISNHLAEAGHEVISISQPHARGVKSIKNLVYKPAREVTKGIHHYLVGTESAILNGQAVARILQTLKQQGFVPDAVIGHAGWGETLYVKDVFPDTKLINYLEFFYHATGADTGFDPEYPNEFDDYLRIRTKNIVNLLAVDGCDAGISPTEWQKSLYPPSYQSKISVIHEGIDTQIARPDPEVNYILPNGIKLSKHDKVITYVARNLEPYRGFHILMRTLPEICQRHPDCHVLIVGGDEVSYGRRNKEGKGYREILLEEISINPDQVHFLGKLPYKDYMKVLQVSSAHVYLTVPFVLSWSMLEAMATGCLVIASDTPPVKEVIRHKENGLLVDFFSPSAIAETVDLALYKSTEIYKISEKAKHYIQTHFPVKKSIQQYKDLLTTLTGNTI